MRCVDRCTGANLLTHAKAGTLVGPQAIDSRRRELMVSIFVFRLNVRRQSSISLVYFYYFHRGKSSDRAKEN